ncbi:helix-turn-helix domain-containing protein [Rhizobium sp. NZLR8]|uniref:helix-turn-helix domain-containing protein n=1 Tax=Rhizobium sp. NZLR8 TaxID=2731104 RepID=UPI001C828E26|nr:helix-turn-helix domain-containing protein [Rhizobium sp. NZLR8]MBX5159243.1 helix-turn-helix domain-containing protein [Rhizobium sp. NZLR8]
MKRNHDRAEWIASRDAFLIERHMADAMAAPHWHDHVELNLLMEGQMTYLFNGRQEQVEAGRLVLFWAAIPHQTIAVTENAPLVCAYLPLVDFLALPVDRGARQLIMQGRFLTQGPQENPDVSMFARWEREWQSGSKARRKLIVDEVRLRIRRLILDNAKIETVPTQLFPAPMAGHAVGYVEGLIDLINMHYANPISIPELAKRANIHPSTANSAFRKVLGISVNEYLIRYRMARAMQLLTDTDAPILQIGYDCGFGSSSRFYEIFKGRTGTTPRHFRESVSGMNPLAG